MLLRIWVGVCALSLLGACRLDTTVAIRMESSGRGVLRIEAVADAELVETATRLGRGDPVSQFRTSDLEAAGWRVVRDPQGRRLVLEHGFANPEELAGLVSGLDPGVAAPILVGFRAQRDHTLFADTYSVAGRVDLGEGGSSEPLSELLQGLEPALVNRIAGADLRRSFSLTVEVALPGEVGQTNSPVARGGARLWPVEPGQVVDLSTSARRRNLLAIATAAGVALLLLLVVILSGAVALAARRRSGS